MNRCTRVVVVVVGGGGWPSQGGYAACNLSRDGDPTRTLCPSEPPASMPNGSDVGERPSSRKSVVAQSPRRRSLDPIPQSPAVAESPLQQRPSQPLPFTPVAPTLTSLEAKIQKLMKYKEGEKVR